MHALVYTTVHPLIKLILWDNSCMAAFAEMLQEYGLRTHPSMIYVHMKITLRMHAPGSCSPLIMRLLYSYWSLIVFKLGWIAAHPTNASCKRWYREEEDWIVRTHQCTVSGLSYIAGHWTVRIVHEYIPIKLGTDTATCCTRQEL